MTIDTLPTKSCLQTLVEEFLPTIRTSRSLAADVEGFCQRLRQLDLSDNRFAALRAALGEDVDAEDWDSLIAVVRSHHDVLKDLAEELGVDDWKCQEFINAINEKPIDRVEIARAIDDLLLRPDAELRQHLESFRDHLERLPEGTPFKSSIFCITARVFATRS